MARVQYGSEITELTGSIGGISFQKNSSGNVARLKPNFKFGASPLQALKQSEFAYVAALWSSLSGIQQSDWNTFAGTLIHYNRFNKLKVINGYQAFCLCNLNLITIGQTLINDAPLTDSFLPVPDFEIVAYSNSLHLDFYPAFTDTDYDLVFFASAPTRASSLQNRKNLLFIGNIQASAISIVDITTMYETAFGLTWSTLFNTGNFNIQFQVISINRATGIASPYTGNILSVRNFPEVDYPSAGLNFSSLGSLFGVTTVLSSVYLENGIALVGMALTSKMGRSIDYGATWTDLGSVSVNSQVLCFCYVGGGVVVAGTFSTGNVLRSTDYGATWTDLGQQFAESSVNRIVLLSNNDLLGVTSNGGLVIRSADAGLTWSSLGQLATETAVTGLVYLENGICLAGSFPAGKVFRSVDFGTTWSDLGTMFAYTSVTGFAYCGGGIVVGTIGNTGAMIRSVDYGATWSDLGVFASQLAIQFVYYLGNSVVVAGSRTGGLFFISVDSGATWVNRGNLFSQSQLRTFSLLGRNVLLLGTGNGGLLLREVL